MNVIRPARGWDSGHSAYQARAYERTPGLSTLIAPTPYSGAASGRRWSYPNQAAQFAIQKGLEQPTGMQGMGDIFDGCTDKTEMMAFMVALKADGIWKGIGIGTVVGLGLAGAAVYFLRK